MTSYELIKSRLKVKRDKGDMCQCICPSHDDKQASLTVTYDSNKKATLLKCHAGCDTETILQALGLEYKDLFDNSLYNNYTTKKDNIEAIYKYFDEEGNLLFEKVRFKGKKFSQRRKLGSAIIWGLDEGNYYEIKPGCNEWSRTKKQGAKKQHFPECRKVIYNLPKVIEGVKNNQTIFIVEGEKDANNLAKWGYITTTTFDGASKSNKWREEYNQYLKAANVIIIPDNDEPGKAHAKNIANNLVKVANSVKIVELNDLKDKEDISDWISKGHTKEELEELINKTSEYKVENNQIEQAIQSLPKGLFEYNNCYCRMNKDGEIIEITNFIIEPLEMIESEDIKELKCKIITKEGRETEKIFNVKDFMSGHQGFKKALNDLLIFKGRDNELEEIKDLITHKNYDTKTGLKVTGFHQFKDGWIFATNSKVVNSNFEELTNYVMLQNNLELDTDILNNETINKEELGALLMHLFRFNEPGIAATIISFTAAIFLKERLWRVCKAKFPHLLITGQAGAGKTQTVENIICPILNITPELEDASSITKFSVIKKSASSNFVPLIIDEYKPSKLSKFIFNEISNLLRNVYDRHVFNRGTSNLKIIEWQQQAPLILIGEDGFTETAVLERILSVNLSKQDSKAYEKSFKFLKDNTNLLKKLGKALLEVSFNITDDELKEVYEKYLKIIPGEVQADRVKNSIAVAFVGLNLIMKLLIKYDIDNPELYGIDFEKVKKYIISKAIDEVLEGGENSKSSVDATLEYIDILADPSINKLIKGVHFKLINNNEELAIDVKTIYYVIQQEKNIPDDILSERQFTKNLKKESYYKDYKAVVLNEDAYSTRIKRKRCYVLSVKELIKKIEVSNLIDFKYYITDEKDNAI